MKYKYKRLELYSKKHFHVLFALRAKNALQANEVR